MSTNIKEYIVGEIAKAFLPLQDALVGNSEFEKFMLEFGYVINTIPQPISNLSTSVNNFETVVAPIVGGTASSSDYVSATVALTNLLAEIENLSNENFSAYPELGNDFNTVFPKRLIDFLIITYFNDEHPTFSSVIRLLGVFKTTYTTPDASDKAPFYLNEIIWGNIIPLIKDPTAILSDLYYWGENDNEVGMVALYSAASQLFAGLGTLFQIGEINYLEAQKIEEDISIPSNVTRHSLDMLYYLKTLPNSFISAGLRLYPLPPQTSRLPGIAFLPYANANFSAKTLLFGSLYLQIDSSIDLLTGLALIFRPGEPIKIINDLNGSGGVVSAGGLILSLINEDTIGNPILLFGSENGTYFKYQSLSLSAGVDLQLPDKEDLYIELQLNGGQLNVSGGDGDGFLQKIIPSNGIKSNVDLLIGFSSKRGFYFNTSGGLETKISSHVQLGPLEISSILISTLPKDSNLPINVAADLKLKLGPFDVAVSGVGVSGNFSFPGSGGNLGPIDFGISFKPPTGLGLKLKSGTVTGGGFLSFNKDEGRYVGALELSVKDKIAIKAIGILTTKLPSGQPGYSLLLLITAEFQPIQLGFGFTLNGVGGIIALHRRMNTDGLRDGVRNGSIDNILFPTNPVENIDSIISSLETVFPIQEGKYSFGPMAIIGWGTPTLITAELGLFFELPGANEFALIGIIRALLPNKDKPVLKLQIAFAGIINFEKKTITFDATLFDSSVAGMGLSGDMVFRLVWGDKPTFVLSVGGFHPKFPIPPLNIPNMRRLTINLIDGEKPRLTLSTYFAITSNTAQFGAAIDFLWAINDNIDLRGHLGFDALFYFSPFRFEASIDGSLEVRRKDKAILSISFAGLLEGPTPWHVQGSVSFKVLGVEFDKDFDKTFGDHDTTTLPDVKVLDKLIVALEDKKNWQATVSDDVPLLVTIREFNTSGPEVVVHPQGKLAVSQKIVPLDIDITRFGNCRPDPTGYSYFSLNISYDASTANILQKDPLKEYFAPNEFFNLSETDRLNSASFQELTSGLEVKSTSTALKGGKPRRRRYEYEQIIMDSRRSPVRMLSPSTVAVAFRTNSTTGTTAANSTLGSASIDRLRASDAPLPITETEASFAIARTSNLTNYNSLTANSRIEAQKILERELLLNPALEGQLQIVNQFEVAV